MKQATLCLLVKPGEILLAMKKRSFGMGRWNGPGGKLDFGKGDKNIVDAVIRETKEEIGVLIKNPEKVGILHFYFPHKEEWNQDVHLFLVKNWEGEPAESEEMSPKWFKTSEIPYEKMWDDDKYWLPHVLSGKKLEADFIFREGDIIEKHNVKIVEEI
ncbi:MAG: 8-oxo-dGTP diphosphatase [Patescibacteria group bacterium]